MQTVTHTMVSGLMTDDGMIAALAADLRPVTPLDNPMWRASGWMTLVLAMADGLQQAASDASAAGVFPVSRPQTCTRPWAACGSSPWSPCPYPSCCYGCCAAAASFGPAGRRPLPAWPRRAAVASLLALFHKHAASMVDRMLLTSIEGRIKTPRRAEPFPEKVRAALPGALPNPGAFPRSEATGRASRQI